MNAREIIHIWANQSKPAGKCGNVFFEGGTIYSYGYHFPMAHLARLDDGTRVALVNPDRASVTTSKQQGYVRQAIHGREVFHISPSSTAWHHLTTRAAVEAAVEKQAAEDSASAEATKRFKSEQAKARREQKKLDALDAPVKLAAWRAGDNRFGLIPTGYGSPVYLRLSADGRNVETSKGARVPVSAAKRAWPVILSGDPDASFDWGNYTGISLEAGKLVVGCHHIDQAEVFYIAEALGLKDKAA